TLRDVAAGTRAGPGFFYHLAIAPPEPEVRLTVEKPTLTLKPGASLEVAVTVFQAFQPKELSLRIEGLPAGVTAAPVTVPGSPGKSGTTQVKLKLTAEMGAAPADALVRIT